MKEQPPKENPVFGPPPPALPWFEAFGSPKGFRYTLATRTRPVNGLTETERERLIQLDDNELKKEMGKNLDLTNFLLQ